MLLTIFTPTYNRAYIIGKLYQSLCKQTCKDFEWLIVDDGSTDETHQIIESFIEEGVISINYIKQPNGGKHRAINRGAKEAKGKLFFIVDSDDYLTNDALRIIEEQFLYIQNNESFAGVCGLRCYPDGSKIGGEQDFGILECNCLDFRYKRRINGDMAEVVRTDVIRKYPFPEIENERFCTEALIWNRIALKYKMRFFYEKIYVCSYLPDGLTAHMRHVRMNSPVYATMFYKELMTAPVPVLQKLKAAINYWRFKFCDNTNVVPPLSFRWLWLIPISLLMHLNDLRYK